MTQFNLYHWVTFLFLTMACLVSTSAHARDTQNDEECIEFPYTNRVAWGMDKHSYEEAEKQAIKLFKDTKYMSLEKQCGGDPAMLCTERKTRGLPNHGRGLYIVGVKFACPNDEGISVQDTAPKQFKYSFISKHPQNSASNIKQDLRGSGSPEFRNALKDNCNIDWFDEFELEYDSDTDTKLLRSIDSGVGMVGEYKLTVTITCPGSSPKITVDHEAIGKNRGNPDPKKNWRYEKWWSSESFDAAKDKCDRKVAEKNLCRFRGGAVEITYKEKRSEFYWVSLRYRCRYD